MTASDTALPIARPRGWPASIAFSPRRLLAVRIACAAFLLGIVFGIGHYAGRLSDGHRAGPPGAGSSASSQATVWICSMHPQVRLPDFGQCPLCFMDLVPEAQGGQPAGEAVLSLSPRARELARIETFEVRPRAVTHIIPMAGKVAADETRITYISSYIPGRLDRVYVDFTGILVRKGDHLAEIYSPELLVAQREFLLALQNVERAQATAGSALALENAKSVLQAARRKLELWGIPADVIDRLTRERQPSDHMRLDAPTAGWVTQREGYTGMYVETGTRLFTVVDLTRVWVMLDAYESDIRFIRYGQTVEFETESFAGHTFTGTVAYIDPIVSERTRTVKVRLNVPNENLRLRPGMFARARLHVQLGEGGEVVSSALAGQYICPMHPEIVKPEPSTCDECGMDLVRPESLGYAAAQAPAEKVLAVPVTSVLPTGRRAIVYVERDGDEGPLFEGRNVVLGPRAGDWYVVLSGLAEGERVATRGAVLIDSAMQIQARPSMMQPTGVLASMPSAKHVDAAHAAPSDRYYMAGAAYHAQSRPVIDAYLELVQALGDDNEAASHKALAALRRGATDAVADGLEGAAAAAFVQAMQRLSDTLPRGDAPGMDAMRSALPRMTSAVEHYLHAFGHMRAAPVYRVHCPMAFDNRGADWLQSHNTVHNAYFGAKMLRCGVVKGVIQPDGREGQ